MYFVNRGKFTHAQRDQLSGVSARVKLAIARNLERECKLPINFDGILHEDDWRKHPNGQRIYSALSSLGRVFVTTNYDRWLDQIVALPTLSPAEEESSHITQGRARDVIYKKAELSPAALITSKHTVIHLHGSLEASHEMILTTSDYVEHYANDRVEGPEN